jgi:pimeloyl-ACP methyl ester carboxylesterase
MTAGLVERAAGLYYEERGSGPDTLVWLPGFGQSTEIWEDIAPAFPDHRSILFDLPGHAESRDVDIEPDLSGFAAKIHEAINEIGLERVTLIGYSIGGAIAMRMALDHPELVARVIGVVPWHAEGAGVVDENLDGFASIHGDTDALAGGCAAIAVDDPPRYGNMATVMSQVPEKIWKGWLLAGSRISQADELAGLTVPVAYILGAADTVVPLHKAIEDITKIPDARAVVLSGVGHLCAYEQPALIVRELQTILDIPERPAT